MTWLSDGKSITERLSKARLHSTHISDLIGVCKGVLSDGVVNLQEAHYILQWLEEHRETSDTWPANALYKTLDNMLEDGKLTTNEEGELVSLLAEITGAPVKVKITIPIGIDATKTIERTFQTPTTLPLHEPETGIEFPGRRFVLTGNFSYGSRGVCEAAVLARGGKTQKAVTNITDYLVIGDIGSECWAHSSFGRKIEKAVYLRSAGHPIFIVCESTWVREI